MPGPSADAPQYRVCFVCSGNICRSPIGEIVLRRLLDEAGLADRVAVDSAGTGDWHVGQRADRRTLAVLTQFGFDGTAHRARQFDPHWFAERDLVLAADEGHKRALQRLAHRDEDRRKVRLIRELDPAAVAAGTLEVDDPYFGGQREFERCLAEVEAACRGLVEHLRDELAGAP